MKVIIRYLLLYLAMLVFFTFYSVILDVIFMKVDYGKIPEYNFIGNTLWYMWYFILDCSFIAIPTLVIYNLAITTIPVFTRVKVLRFLMAGALATGIGYLIDRETHSFYIGSLRGTKSIVLFVLIGSSIEVARLIKEYITRKKLQLN